MRRAAPSARRPRRCARPRPRRRADGAAIGRRTTSSLPWPTPALWAPIRPPCISTSLFDSDRPMPRPPCERSSADCTWPNISKIDGQLRGGDADAGVDHAHHRVAALALDRERDPAAARRVLGGVDEQVREHLRQPSQVAVDRDRLGRQTGLERVAGGVDRRLRDLDRLLEHAPAAAGAPCAAGAGRAPSARRRAGPRADATSAPPGARSRRDTTRPGHRPGPSCAARGPRS